MNPQTFQTTLSEKRGEGKHFSDLVEVSFQGIEKYARLFRLSQLRSSKIVPYPKEPLEILIRTARDFFVGSLIPITSITAKHRVFVLTHSTYPS